MKRFVLCTALIASSAFAKPWQGVEPGAASKDDVTKKFGEPSKVMTGKDGKEVLGYFGPRAIKGTQQAQFKIDATTKKVERIDVFPQAQIKKETIEASYGPECPAGIIPDDPCYLKKVTPDSKAYYHYPRLGLAVFFKPDGQMVQSLVFTPDKK